MGFKAAKCPECGADIQVPTGRDVAKCMYCGKDIVVEQATVCGDAERVANWMKLAKAAAKASNHDEAHEYFTKILEVEPENHAAWIGKGIAIGWLSNLRRGRLTEMIHNIEQGIEAAPDGERDATAKYAAGEAIEVVEAYFRLSEEHTNEFVTVDSAWPEHVERCLSMIEALDAIVAWAPDEEEPLRRMLTIIDSVLTGMEYSEADEGYKYLHASEYVQDQLKTKRSGIVSKLQQLDSSFEAPEVKPVSGPGCGCYVAATLVMLIIGAVIILLLAGASQGFR